MITAGRIASILFRDFPIYYISRAMNLLPNNIMTCIIRGFLVAPFLKSHGKNFQLAEGAIINHPEKMEVGNDVYLAHRIYINAQEGLRIGNNVTIGPNCVIATSNHQVENGKVLNSGEGGMVTIGNGTWIGANVTITAGCTVGEGCVVGANAVIVNDPPHVH